MKCKHVIRLIPDADMELILDVQGRAVRKLVTLPKKMLPVRLNGIKDLLLRGNKGLMPLATTANLAAPHQLSSAPELSSAPR